MDERGVRDLEMIIDMFRKAGLVELRVRSRDLSVHLAGDRDADRQEHVPRAPRPDIAVPATARPAAKAAANLDFPAAAAPPSEIDPNWVAVTAPNLGTFYRSPKPGAPAFVEVGQTVGAGTELCLIEVMKLFTSVRAETAGTIRHVAATDGELVEGGQPLIYIEAE